MPFFCYPLCLFCSSYYIADMILCDVIRFDLTWYDLIWFESSECFFILSVILPSSVRSPLLLPSLLSFYLSLSSPLIPYPISLLFLFPFLIPSLLRPRPLPLPYSISLLFSSPFNSSFLISSLVFFSFLTSSPQFFFLSFKDESLFRRQAEIDLNSEKRRMQRTLEGALAQVSTAEWRHILPPPFLCRFHKFEFISFLFDFLQHTLLTFIRSTTLLV